VLEGETVLLWGGSVRPVAQAVRRLGGRPICVDWFGDVDTAACGPVIECRDWSGECERVLNGLSAERGCVVLPLGGMENHPDVLARLERFGQWAAAPREAMGLVRDPMWVASVLREAGCHSLPVHCGDMRELPPWEPERWLCKPVRGVAGRGVRRWAGDAVGGDEYLQAYRDGVAASALFLSTADGIERIGVTRQLIGRAYGAAEFGYAGNVVWSECPAAIVEEATAIARIIANAAGLLGLFGVDGVVGPDDGGVDRWWVCEVNPRPTAAMELFERGGRELIAEHIHVTLRRSAATDGDHLPRGNSHWQSQWHTTGRSLNVAQPSDRDTSVPVRVSCRSKRIVYAMEGGHAAGLESELGDATRSFRPGWIGDVPRDGTRLRAGDPICTVFAEEASVAACEARLAELAARVQTLFVRKEEFATE
jgi:predicted ATP-grasp superfamily ATP-dependent carboligase